MHNTESLKRRQDTIGREFFFLQTIYAYLSLKYRELFDLFLMFLFILGFENSEIYLINILLSRKYLYLIFIFIEFPNRCSRRYFYRKAKSISDCDTSLTAFPDRNIGVRKVVPKRLKLIPIPNGIPMDDALKVRACSASHLEYQQGARSMHSRR